MNLLVVWKNDDGVYLNLEPANPTDCATFIDCVTDTKEISDFAWKNYLAMTEDSPDRILVIPTTATTAVEIRALYPELFL